MRLGPAGASGLMAGVVAAVRMEAWIRFAVRMGVATSVIVVRP
jgi:hypothetical protein